MGAGLPPEVISGLMYAGPGSGPMLTAAAAWDGLAAELHTTAQGFQSVVSALSGTWLGPSALAMASAAAPYVTWLHATAAQAEMVAMQAKTAASAFDTAFAATVPPPVIAANRAQLMVLVATNLLGQNTAAIAANEAEYAAMWAQDVAMFAAYTLSSLAAIQMKPFDPPPKTTNEVGQIAQGVDAGKGVANAGVQQTLMRGLSGAVPQQVSEQGLQLAQATGPVTLQATTPMEDLLDFLIPDLAGLLGVVLGLAGAAIGIIGALVSGLAWADAVPSVEDNKRRLAHLHDEHHEMLEIMGRESPEGWRPGLWPRWVEGDPLWPWTDGNMGNGPKVDGLTVPPSWSANIREIEPLARALPAAGPGATPAVAGASGTAFRELALASMLGRALAGSVSPGSGIGGIKGGTVSKVANEAAKTAVAEAAASPAARTGIAEELRQLAQLRDEGVLTGEEFREQKRRLLE
ncbi:PPE domain-containing protein [Mycobacterium sp. 1274756.6]|uniref:PPE family protein, SVP subgroup n=1 Tax=Mycobacterium sp. 1274756.6 TaxID=1834076 RepID=UPI0007FD9E7C|nr:PPE domain-containing protein [Mycobacterium sp. 1274756.6]OBJ69472.1 hypothetical protein A5643_12305 [Mycobacterium sp. 1274756.6]